MGQAMDVGDLRALVDAHGLERLHRGEGDAGREAMAVNEEGLEGRWEMDVLEGGGGDAEGVEYCEVGQVTPVGDQALLEVELIEEGETGDALKGMETAVAG